MTQLREHALCPFDPGAIITNECNRPTLLYPSIPLSLSICITTSVERKLELDQVFYQQQVFPINLSIN